MEAQAVLHDAGGNGEAVDRFGEAVSYAVRVHAGQHRSGTDQPYVSHLLRVAGLVIEDGGSEDEAIAALLHDAAEDQGGRTRLSDIRRRFGPAVTEIVHACTDSYEDPKPPWRLRKQRYLAHLSDAPAAALRVSLADKLDNVRTLVRDYRTHGEQLWLRSGKGKDDVRWYYRTLATRFSELHPSPLSVDLEWAVRDLDHTLSASA